MIRSGAVTPSAARWWGGLIPQVAEAVATDPFWRDHVRRGIEAGNPTFHLAVLVEPFLGYVLSGQKTVESRFSHDRRAPYRQVESGDILVLKAASGPVVGLCLVLDVWNYRLDTTVVTQLRREFGHALCATTEEFWSQREHANYATLMRIGRVRPLPCIPVTKRDRRGWVVWRPRRSQVGLQALFGSSDEAAPRRVPLRVVASRALSDCASVLPLADHAAAVAGLRTNRWRSEWWERALDPRALYQVSQTPLDELENRAKKRILQSIGRVVEFRGKRQPFRDGYQTPLLGDVIYYAQHGLALCCRKCVADWYGVPIGRDLTDSEVDSFVQLVMKYISLRRERG